METIISVIVFIFFINLAAQLLKKLKKAAVKLYGMARPKRPENAQISGAQRISANASGKSSGNAAEKERTFPGSAPEETGQPVLVGEVTAESAAAAGQTFAGEENFAADETLLDEESAADELLDEKPKRKNPLFIDFINIIRIPFLTIAIEFIFWLLVDIFRALRKGEDKDVHIYGIWCFVGIYGGGKTMSLVRYLENMRDKYGDNVYIATNFFYKNQDFKIESWKDLVKDYDKAVIFGYDELQNEFNSRKYRDFPMALMGMLTQNRKGRGKQIVFTAQNYGAVDKNFRDLCTKVVNCKTHFGRYTVNSFYEREFYEQLRNTVSVDRKLKIRPRREFFIQTDYLRGLYDTRKQLDSAKNSQYLGLEEIRKLRLNDE